MITNQSLQRVVLMAATFAIDLPAQGTAADYRRAASLRGQWSQAVERFTRDVRWLPDERGVYWRDGDRWITVDRTGERRETDDPSEIGIDHAPRRLEPATEWSASPDGGAETSITFENRLDRTIRLFWANRDGAPQQYGTLEPGESREQHTFAGHVWLADFTANDLVGVFIATDNPGLARFDRESRERATQRSSRSEPRRTRVRIRDHNVFATGEDGVEFQLSKNGSEEDPYIGRRHWSPDGTKFLTFQERPGDTRRIPLLDSAPDDDVQPNLSWIDYRKPGDRIPQRRPRLFDVGARTSIEVEESPFLDSWSVGRVHWSSDSRRVYCVFNRRGHAQLAVRAIDATTGTVSTIVDERSTTFVDYSQKTWLHWLDDRGELLWMTERTGHNHIHRFDARTGAELGRVTSGPWVVRRVVNVDHASERIWFVALGLHADQDPYHEHLARVNFDGTGLVALTQSDGTHRWEFSPNRSLLLVRWSRIDQPWVTELRSAIDGSKIAELGRDDASELIERGFRHAERFVANGRDGETDIHGILIRPSKFDASRRYPVIEHIYAGPHGHHVPKAWSLLLRDRQLAELGFVVVRIDGMGTNWRSKAFHDVCWQNLADAGLPDRIAWIRAAAQRHPELDLDRVGIFGGSAGGQNALAALLHHGDFYRAAAADCGCHDNRMDKIWWNEAWMGKLGPHYAANSNVTHAAKLAGKLFLTVGELDRNVDPASTLQVVDALLSADKDFEFYLVPGAGHGVGERADMVRRRSDFFVHALHGVEPRR